MTQSLDDTLKMLDLTRVYKYLNFSMNTSLFQKTMNDLRKLGHTPTKKFGQNFLIDQNVIKKFVRLSGVKSGEIVVEIGPGSGNVSDEILSHEADEHAIELDKRLFNFLTERYSNVPNFRIINGDAVKYPIADLGEILKKNPEKNLSYKIIASLPYAITSAWIDSLLGCPVLPDSISIIIQLDAAERILAQSGTKSYCATSILVQSAYYKSEMYKISRGSFYPIPGVDSVMLFLKKRPDCHIFNDQTKEVIRLIFQNRRKQIGKIIKELSPKIPSWLSTNQIPPNLRPEQISLNVWQNLQNFLPNLPCQHPQSVKNSQKA